MSQPNQISKLKILKASLGESFAQFRESLTSNLTVKLFALFIAITIWGFVASQKRGESTELKFNTPLVLKQIPPNLEVTSSQNESVSVLVSLRRDLSYKINPNEFQVVIDLRNQLPGPFEYRLNAKNVIYDNEATPTGVQVLQISPTTIPLMLEETVQKTVPIKPRFFGEMSKGFALQSIRIEPPRAAVKGPESVLKKLTVVLTRPLDIQDLKNDVDMLAHLDLPPMVRLANPKESLFKAFIAVSSNPTRVLFRNIPIIFENTKNKYKASTTSLNAHLEGPKEVMMGLDIKKVFAVIDLAKFPPGDYRALAPKVVTPETVKVLEQWPILDLFVLKKEVPKPKPPKAIKKQKPKGDKKTKGKKSAKTSGNTVPRTK